MTIILPDNRKPKPPATVLRGPADADAFRVKVGRYGERWYTDSLPGCAIAPASEANHPSVSAVKKAKPFEGADYVAMKRIAKELTPVDGFRRGLPADYDACYEWFKSVNKLGLDAAGKRGTDVHKQFELGLYGKPFQPGGPGSHYLPAIQAFFDAYQPTLVAAELVCIQRDLNDIGYGGTADAIVAIDGKTYLVDWKSRSEDGDHAAYPEEGAQLAAYATADYMVGEGDDGMAKRLPIPALDGLLIVSVKPDGCRIYPIDIDKATPYFHTLHGWWCARREERSVIGRPWPTKTVAVPKPEPAPVEPPALRHADGTPLSELELLYEESAAIGEWIAETDDDAPDQRKRLAEIEARISELESVAVESGRAPATDGGVEAVDPASASPADPFDGLTVTETHGVATRPYVAPLEPKPRPAPAYSDDDLIDDATYDAFQAEFKALDDGLRAGIGKVAQEANVAGHPISVQQRRSVRRFEIGRALVLWARWDPSEDALRTCLCLATGHEDVMQPGIPVGAAVGVLTKDEAVRLANAIDALAGGAVLTSDPITGLPELRAA